MMSLMTEFANWVDSLPESIGLLLLGAILFALTNAMRRAPASAEPRKKAPMVRRRMGSPAGFTAQRGRS